MLAAHNLPLLCIGVLLTRLFKISSHVYVKLATYNMHRMCSYSTLQQQQWPVVASLLALHQYRFKRSMPPAVRATKQRISGLLQSGAAKHLLMAARKDFKVAWHAHKLELAERGSSPTRSVPLLATQVLGYIQAQGPQLLVYQALCGGNFILPTFVGYSLPLLWLNRM